MARGRSNAAPSLRTSAGAMLMRDFAVREFQGAACDGRLHAFDAFFYGFVGHSYHSGGEAWFDGGFDGDFYGVDALEGCAVDFDEHTEGGFGNAECRMRNAERGL